MLFYTHTQSDRNKYVAQSFSMRKYIFYLNEKLAHRKDRLRN